MVVRAPKIEHYPTELKQPVALSERLEDNYMNRARNNAKFSVRSTWKFLNLRSRVRTESWKSWKSWQSPGNRSGPRKSPGNSWKSILKSWKVLEIDNLINYCKIWYLYEKKSVKPLFFTRAFGARTCILLPIISSYVKFMSGMTLDRPFT